MQILAIVLVGLYALLHFFLAFAGSFLYSPAAQASVVSKAIPALLFVLAGGVLAAAIMLRSTWSVAAGLLIASLAPIAYGALVEGENVWLHHLVRAAFAAAIMVLWLIAFRNSST